MSENDNTTRLGFSAKWTQQQLSQNQEALLHVYMNENHEIFFSNIFLSDALFEHAKTNTKDMSIPTSMDDKNFLHGIVLKHSFLVKNKVNITDINQEWLLDHSYADADNPTVFHFKKMEIAQ